MSSEVSGICVCVMLISFATLLDSLMLVVLSRHFEIIKVTNVNIRPLQICIYGIYALSYILSNSAPIVAYIYSFDDTESYETLVTNVAGADAILKLQPSLFAFKFSWNFTIFYIIFTTCLYFGFRGGITLWLLYSNLTYSRNENLSHSKQSKQRFNLMFHTTMAQFFTVATFGIPCIIWLGLLLSPTVPSELQGLHIYMVEATSLFPIADVIIVVFVVRSYRNATLKIFKFRLKFNLRKSNVAIAATEVQSIRPRANSLFVKRAIACF